MSLISLVILDDIEVPDGLSSKFDADKIDKAAQNIIALGGLIRPLILQRLDYESYKLISGEFELAAMLRAQEIDQNKEQVECFICGNNTLLGDLDETYLHEATELFVDNKENSPKQMSNDAVIEIREQVQKENDEEIATMRNKAIVEIEAMRHEAQEKLIEERATERARLAGMYKPKPAHIRRMVMNFISLEGEVSVKGLWLHLAENGYDFERRQVGQRLAYLNKKGLINRTGRGIYSDSKVSSI